MHAPEPRTATRPADDVRLVRAGAGPTPCTVYVRRLDRRTRRLLETLRSRVDDLTVVDLDEDPAAARYVERLACGQQPAAVVDVAGLTLFAPRATDVLAALDERSGAGHRGAAG